MTPGRANAWTSIVGGALVCAGTMLPWISFFAGLQSLSGVVGLYGRILFASGILAVLSGTAMLHRRSRWLLASAAMLGVLQTLFVAWLLLGLRSTLGQLGMHAMLIARPGAGLFVALAGAMLVSTAALRLPFSHVDRGRRDTRITSYGDEKVLN